MVCPHCKKWEISTLDTYCSWCREKLVDFEVSLNIRHVYVGDVLADPVTLTIEHTGTVGSIRIDEIESDQGWLRINKKQQPYLALGQGARIELPVEIDAMLLPDDYHEARIRVVSPIGSRFATFEVVPRPEIQVFTGEYTVLLDGLAEGKLSGYLAVTRGIVSIAELATDVSWAQAKFVNGDACPYKLDARRNSRLEFEFNFDEEELLRLGDTLPAEYKGNLIIKYAELQPERTYPFHVNCFLPPKLVVKEATGMRINLDIFTDKRGEQVLTLENGERDQKGYAELQILGISIDAGWLQPATTITYPLVIQSGQYKELSFTAIANEAGEGSHIAKISILTNTPGPDRQKEVYIGLNVKQMPDFDGVLAIDFGTVNSCCATFDKIDEHGNPTRIKIDRPDYNEHPTTAPSAIVYYDKLDGNVKDYEIGGYAYQVSFDPRSAPSTVRQIKRRLGRSERITVSYLRNPAKQDSYLPREVAADILKRILERAEEELEGRINHCTISHPSRFSLRQIEDLKAALVACGIHEENIRTMHEPLGAALSYIQQKKEQEHGPEYHLMVYDFGGGTTDITLLHVSSRLDAKHDVTVITPRVLGATGDRWWGGEDITDLVMQLALEKCREVLRSQYPEATNIVIPFDRENFPTDPRRQQFAVDNRILLRQWAEASKIAIAEFGDDHSEPNSVPALTVIIDNDPKFNQTFIHKNVVPQQAALDDQLRPRLLKLVEMMKRLAKNNGVESPNVVLLSGKSSALPIVRKVIKEAFPGSDVHTPKDLKECVVLGACQLSHTDPVAGVFLNVEQDGYLSATTSRLGIRVREVEQLKFKELIDAGVPIQASGLRVPVNGIILRRNTRIRILENTGLDDEMVINGKENLNITELKVFRLEQKLAEWERSHDHKITDQVLFNARIELEVTPNLSVRLTAKIPEIVETFDFEAEFTGW